MKNQFLRFIGGLASLLMATQCAIASPFTYQFTKGYNYNEDTTLFGTSAVFNVTFDNGGTTNQNALFNWDSIKRVDVSTVGGTFSKSFSPTSSYWDLQGTDTFLQTDASGNGGIFTWNTSPAVNYVVAYILSPIGDFFYLQLGTQGAINIDIGFESDLNNTSAYAEFQPPLNQTSGLYDSWTAVATLQNGDTSIPEPSSISLLVSGILGFGYTRRKATQV